MKTLTLRTVWPTKKSTGKTVSRERYEREKNAYTIFEYKLKHSKSPAKVHYLTLGGRMEGITPAFPHANFRQGDMTEDK